MAWLYRYPVRFTLGIILGLASAATIGLWMGLSRNWSDIPWLLCWLVSLNVVTFAAYGIDKRQAQTGGWRIPELTLLTAAFLGGTIGAWAGMAVFRHKTIKGKFRLVFWLLVALQIGLVALLIKELIQRLPDAH